ncbi:MAG: hypothetical protein ACFFGZ_16845 [Candidatus Thorarchaeota archaeon]
MASKHLGSAKIDTGKVELPENVLDFLFCLEGDLLEFVEKDGEIVLRRSTRDASDPRTPQAAIDLSDETLEESLEEIIETAIEDSLDEVGLLKPDSIVDEFLDVLVQRLVSDLLALYARAAGKKPPGDFANLVQNIISNLTGTDPSKLAESLDFRKFFEGFSMPPFQGGGSSQPHTRVVIEDYEDIVDVDADDDSLEGEFTPPKRTKPSSKKKHRIPIEDDEDED